MGGTPACRRVGERQQLPRALDEPHPVLGEPGQAAPGADQRADQRGDAVAVSHRVRGLEERQPGLVRVAGEDEHRGGDGLAGVPAQEALQDLVPVLPRAGTLQGAFAERRRSRVVARTGGDHRRHDLVRRSPSQGPRHADRQSCAGGERHGMAVREPRVLHGPELRVPLVAPEEQPEGVGPHDRTAASRVRVTAVPGTALGELAGAAEAGPSGGAVPAQRRLCPLREAPADPLHAGGQVLARRVRREERAQDHLRHLGVVAVRRVPVLALAPPLAEPGHPVRRERPADGVPVGEELHREPERIADRGPEDAPGDAVAVPGGAHRGEHAAPGTRLPRSGAVPGGERALVPPPRANLVKGAPAPFPKPGLFFLGSCFSEARNGRKFAVEGQSDVAPEFAACSAMIRPHGGA